MDRNVKINNRMRIFALKDVDTVCDELGVSAKGLTASQVHEMWTRYQTKQAAKQRTSIFSVFKTAFVNPFNVLLFVLAVLSLITAKCLNTAASYHNLSSAFIIMGVLFISGGLRFYQEIKTTHVLDQVQKTLKMTVTVRRDGLLRAIPADELVIGDVVILSAGDQIPADVRILKSNHLFVSQSSLTGESKSFEKKAEHVYTDSRMLLINAVNLGYKGTTVTSGHGEAIVLAIGDETLYGLLSKNPLPQALTFDMGTQSITFVLIRFIFVLVPLVFLLAGFVKADWANAFLLAVSVAIGLVPELFPFVINACRIRGSILMRKKQTVVKNIDAVQAFGSLDVLCVDKTGTLTGDEVLLEYYMDVIGNESQHVLEAGILNSVFHTGANNLLDKAIAKYLDFPGKEAYFRDLIEQTTKLDELPFDYQRKFANVLIRTSNMKHRMIIKGELEAVSARCTSIDYGGNVIPVQEAMSKDIQAIVGELVEDGLKVLAVAYKDAGHKETLSLEDEYDLVLSGFLVFFDAPKKSASSALEKLAQLQVQVKVLTGDQVNVTRSICRRLGMDTTKILSGKAIELLSEDDLVSEVESHDIFAELSPKDKALVVQTLRRNGHTVGFLGDGMNDLPAILEADVGISVDTATRSIKKAADVILLKKDLNVMESSIIEGRKALANMSKYVRVTASSNFGNALSIVLASIFLPFLPMTSIQLLILNIFYDCLCMALPWDTVDVEDFEKPFKWSGNGLGRFMIYFGPISSVFDMITFGFLLFVVCPMLVGVSYSDISTPEIRSTFVSLFQTGWFLVSIWTQVLILQLLRTRNPLIRSNRTSVIMLVLVGVTLIGSSIIVFTPIGQWIGLSPLPLEYFIFLIAIMLGYGIAIIRIKKHYIKRYHTLT